jgi:hypothetical protein
MCPHIHDVVSYKHTAFIFSPADEGSMFLRNVGIYLQVHTTLQPRRPTSTKIISLLYLVPSRIMSALNILFQTRVRIPLRSALIHDIIPLPRVTILSGDIYLACSHTISYLLLRFHFRTTTLFHFEMLLPPSNTYIQWFVPFISLHLCNPRPLIS